MNHETICSKCKSPIPEGKEHCGECGYPIGWEIDKKEKLSLRINKRLSFDDYFMKICDVVAQRATCPRKSVGAVVVKNGRLLSTGYNGAPRRFAQCNDVGCKVVNNHCVRVVHAEMNALLFAGREAEGATLYSTTLPCEICFKLCVQAGIKRVVYKENYNKDSVQWIINESGIKYEQLNESEEDGKQKE